MANESLLVEGGEVGTEEVVTEPGQAMMVQLKIEHEEGLAWEQIANRNTIVEYFSGSVPNWGYA